MGWFIPILAFVGRTVVQRPILSTAGVIIGWEILDIGGTPIGEFTEEKIGDALTELTTAGVNVVESLAETGSGVTLQFVEGLGPALVRSVDAAYDAIRDKFVSGKEPDIIAGFTLGTLVILASVYLYQSVKNSNDAF